MPHLTGTRLMAVVAVLTSMIQVALALPSGSRIAEAKVSTDWSTAMVESTMKSYPTAKDLGSWGYAKSLYLDGKYMVWKRTREPRYLKYIKDWVDSHVNEKGVVTNTNAE